MKKIHFAFLLVLVFCMIFVSCSLFDEDEVGTFIAYIDWNTSTARNSKGITLGSFLSNKDNPFYNAYDLTGIDDKKAGEYKMNAMGVPIQTMPMIPSISSRKGNINSFVQEMRNKPNEHPYGFTKKLDKIVPGTDGGYFARFYLYASDKDTEPFYQIDCYFKERTFSYRGVMMLNMGNQGNDSIRYFQLKNVEIKGNGNDCSYVAGKANDYRIDVLDFTPMTETPITGFKISSWNLAINNTRNLVVSTGMNPRFTSQTNFTEDMKNALEVIYLSNTDYENGEITIRTDQGISSGLDPELWNIENAKEFMKSYTTWTDSEFPFDKQSYDSLENFNSSMLTVTSNTDIVFSSPIDGFYYPCIYSIHNNENKCYCAILDPKDRVVLSEGNGNDYDSEKNKFYRKNFDLFFDTLGITSTTNFTSFTNMLKSKLNLN